MKLSKEYVENAKNDSLIVDAFISNSTFSTKRYRKDFWFNGEIIESGLPRNDIFYINAGEKDELKLKVKKFFNLDQNIKILLYAPTFRKNFNTDIYLHNLSFVQENLSKRFGGNWVSLVHLHPNLFNKNVEMIYNKNFIDSGSYPDFQELLVACDVLLTDYSSTMFEFSFELKPVFLYMADLKEYKQDRDFEIDLNDLPFAISHNLKELKNNILEFNKEKYDEQLISFFNRLELKETGNASKIIVNKIKEELNL